jgi:hypothetical protein
MNINLDSYEDASLEAKANEWAMHKTKRRGITYYWTWNDDCVMTEVKMLAFEGGFLANHRREFITRKLYDFKREFEWALTEKQAEELYNKITAY